MSEEEIAVAWPLHGLIEDVCDFLAVAVKAYRRVVLATVCTTSGSSIRGIGAQMALTERDVAGSVAGGCIDADVIRRCRPALEHGTPQWLTYGEGGPIDLRPPCGKSIGLFVETLSPDEPALLALLEARRDRRNVVWMSDGNRRVCHQVAGRNILRAPAGVMSKSRFIWRQYTPRLRLVVCGYDASMLLLCKAAILFGFETILLRPGGPEVPPPIEGLRYLRSSPADAIAHVMPDPWTSIIAASHDAENDLKVLSVALTTNAGHIGLLGSRSRRSGLVDSLRELGFDDFHMARVRAPVGLTLGSKAPSAIAASIIAEIVQDLSGHKEQDEARLRLIATS